MGRNSRQQALQVAKMISSSVLVVGAATNTKFPRVSLLSTHNLLAHDVVIWNANNLTAEVKNRFNINEGSSVNSHQHIEEINNRINDLVGFLDQGRTAVIFLNTLATYYTISRALKFEMALCPLIAPAVTRSVSGRVAEFVGPRTAAEVGEKIAPSLAYSVVYQVPKDAKIFAPLFFCKKSKVVMGFSRRFENGGILLVLPEPALGHLTPPEAQIHFDEYVKRIVELAKLLQLDDGKTASSLPDWCSSVVLPDEVEALEKKVALTKQHDEISANLLALESDLAKFKPLKQLVAATGTDLEKAVMDALTVFGALVTEGAPKRADLILRHEGKWAVVEVKGLQGVAGEGDVRQAKFYSGEAYLVATNSAPPDDPFASQYNAAFEALQLRQDDAGELPEPKAILVANTFRDLPLEQRSTASFPENVVKMAERDQVCLVTGLQLLAMIADIQRKVKTGPELLAQILETKGALKYREGI